jgi:hypothetical protein
LGAVPVADLLPGLNTFLKQLRQHLADDTINLQTAAKSVRLLRGWLLQHERQLGDVSIDQSLQQLKAEHKWLVGNADYNWFDCDSDLTAAAPQAFATACTGTPRAATSTAAAANAATATAHGLCIRYAAYLTQLLLMLQLQAVGHGTENTQQHTKISLWQH